MIRAFFRRIVIDEGAPEVVELLILKQQVVKDTPVVPVRQIGNLRAVLEGPHALQDALHIPRMNRTPGVLRILPGIVIVKCPMKDDPVIF